MSAASERTGSLGRHRQIFARIWNDEKFRALSRDAKLIFIFFLTSPAQTLVGGMRASVPGLAAELQMTEADFRGIRERVGTHF